MIPWKTKLTRLTLDGLYYSNAYKLLEPFCQGVGVIFTMHHVLESHNTSQFPLNRILEISSDFLDSTIVQILNLGYDIISLDEARQRLIDKNFDRKFVCFTLDDGYIDNYQHALPVFVKHNVPFTIYLTTGLPDSTAILWWRCLEHLVLQEDCIEITLNHKSLKLACVTRLEKNRAFDTLYWLLRRLPDLEQQTAVLKLITKYNIDSKEICKKLAIPWEMLQELTRHPLVTIGSHTVNHFALSKLTLEQVKQEAANSRQIIQDRLGCKVEHFCYPYGDKLSADAREFTIISDLGFKTATTTRKDVIQPDHAQHLHALPRISLNGDYQKARFVRMFLSGVPTALRKTIDY